MSMLRAMDILYSFVGACNCQLPAFAAWRRWRLVANLVPALAALRAGVFVNIISAVSGTPRPMFGTWCFITSIVTGSHVNFGSWEGRIHGDNEHY
ncbi:hypothetical protein OF83DRAFT_1099504 [Amylostereum chailletii]|nr:hypothetical protein OF83DRAFT_1099504 [Amylostereum chailletii]